ncbi:hypothetical protein BDV38DRAFT_284445 [Aspergillus pseudotamarii]|uniref:Uncharacterized protein n=1 Tax=Aspergillus pseudotamarii TaxID=132259 RepID=A0A5N6SQC7_ASPPS|nr:uncharacterized protein BDV38DRAFT_284445 [Aspergillus pseudotamarii]KAE8135970.1 hypothetical protein BDV38DRAFT_284445 [Aspergillus pseudotamarii]
MVKFKASILLLAANAAYTLAASKPRLGIFRDARCTEPRSGDSATVLDRCFTLTRYDTNSVKIDPGVPKCPDNSAPVARLYASPWCTGDSQSFPSNITGCQPTNITDFIYESWELECPRVPDVPEKKPIYLETFYDSGCDVPESNTTATGVDMCMSIESEHTRAYRLMGLNENENLCKNQTAELMLYTGGNCTGKALPPNEYQGGCNEIDEVGVTGWKIHCA